MFNRGTFSLLAGNRGKSVGGFALTVAFACAVVMLAPAPAAAQDTPMTAQLSSALNSGSAHKGDIVEAQVTSPAGFQGDTISGEVMQSSSSHGVSTLQITLDSLRHAGIVVPIAVTIQSVSNSKGRQGVDEGGVAINATTLPGKAANHGSRWGSNIGSLIGGTSGEVVGDASDASSTKGTPPSTQLSAPGSGFHLAGGATFGFSVQSKGNTDLASLAPNAPAGVPAASSAPNPAVEPSSSTAPAPSATAPQSASDNAGGAQPDLKSTPIDFVPGERTIFFDDFSDMDADEPPPHWKVRGGTVELRTGGNVRELYTPSDVNLKSPQMVIPSNFTFQVIWTGIGQMIWRFLDKDGNQVMWAQLVGDDDGQGVTATVTANNEGLGGDKIKTDTSQPIEFDLWAQQGRVRGYLNGHRIEDANQVEFAPIVYIAVDAGTNNPDGIRTVRVAESAPDFSSVINSTGKYVTHGINFDTDSDVLKPESAAVIKQVASGLNKNPNLKLEIDGYTDSVGDAKHNLDLSKRRAEAVMSVLVSQFGIDAGRLSANGFGAAKPIGSNDTPDGRAANRRVEFIKK